MNTRPISNADLESLWHGQKVIVKDDVSPHVRAGEYIVTAAFWDTDIEIVFALMDVNYSVDNPNWVAFHLSYQEWLDLTSRLEPLNEIDLSFMSKFMTFKRECESR